MQNVQLYVQGEKDVVGTIVFAQTDVITSNVMDFISEHLGCRENHSEQHNRSSKLLF